MRNLTRRRLFEKGTQQFDLESESSQTPRSTDKPSGTPTSQDESSHGEASQEALPAKGFAEEGDTPPREIVYTREGGELGTVDGSPLFGETFSFDTDSGKAELKARGGGMYSFGATADFRNTVFNFEQLDPQRRTITFASVRMSDDLEYSVVIQADAIGADRVYFDSKHVAFPDEIRAIPSNGPFVNLSMTCSYESSPLQGALIEHIISQGAQETVSTEANGEALMHLESVDSPTVLIRVSHPSRNISNDVRLALPIVSAAPELIEYFGIEICYKLQQT